MNAANNRNRCDAVSPLLLLSSHRADLVSMLVYAAGDWQVRAGDLVPQSSPGFSPR